MKREYCVYMHTFPNGKVYIGQTRRKPKYRFNNGEGYKGCKYVYSAIQKYGWDNIKHEILMDSLTRDEADYWEDCFITLYQSTNKTHGYNLRSGGTSGYEYTEDVKMRIGNSHRGKKQSEETRKKHSEALQKYYATHEVSEETRQKLRDANKGRPGEKLTTEQKAKAMQNIQAHQFKKGHAPSLKSMNTLREKTSRRVAQCDLNGNVITTYRSIKDAAKAVGLTRNAVGNCVRGRTKITGGYIWKYAEET